MGVLRRVLDRYAQQCCPVLVGREAIGKGLRALPVVEYATYLVFRSPNHPQTPLSTAFPAKEAPEPSGRIEITAKSRRADAGRA